MVCEVVGSIDRLLTGLGVVLVVVENLPDVELPAERGQVEVVVGAEEQIAAPRVRGVGVKDAVAVAEEDTRAGLLALRGPGLARLYKLRPVPVVVLNGGDGLVQRDVEVVVEVAAERRIEGDSPAHARLEPLDVRRWPARDDRERRVGCVQVREVPDVVDQERAARAARVQVPPPHEVIDDQLTAPLEQVQQARLAIGTLEDIVLVDLDHRELAPPGVERVMGPGQRLLVGKQFLAGNQPLSPRHALRKTHLCSPFLLVSLSKSQTARRRETHRRLTSHRPPRSRGLRGGGAQEGGSCRSTAVTPLRSSTVRSRSRTGESSARLGQILQVCPGPWYDTYVFHALPARTLKKAPGHSLRRRAVS